MQHPAATLSVEDGTLAYADPLIHTLGKDHESRDSAPSSSEPLVSVILVVQDREACVGRAIDSVLAQEYPALELIVVDDGSSDGTADRVKAYGDRVRLFRRDHAGPYAARNFALGQARGDLVAFIDSDDAWLPRKLALQIPLMRQPEVALVFGDTIHLSAPYAGAPRTGRTSFGVTPPRRGRVAADLVWGNFVPTCTVLVRKSALEAIGGFATTSPIAADYPAWFGIARDHELDFVDAPVAEYSVHAGGISYNLGRSLAARLRLFSAELDRARDRPTRRRLQRLRFNLALHLGLAAVRGRASAVDRPWRLAAGTAWNAAGPLAPLWALGFARHQLAMRWRRRAA